MIFRKRDPEIDVVKCASNIFWSLYNRGYRFKVDAFDSMETLRREFVKTAVYYIEKHIEEGKSKRISHMVVYFKDGTTTTYKEKP